jgi:nucleotide-binding universal stress UspA family protein
MKIHIQKILCATDLSDFSNSAVIQAIGMATAFGSKLFICHVIDLPMVSMHGTAFVYPQDQIDEMKANALNQIKGLVKASNLDWEAVVQTGPISSTLCRLAAEKQADIAIVSTHGHTGLKRLFLGSVTERLLRTIGCPLLVVTPSEKAPSAERQFKGFGFKQIMVGCDFSTDSGRAVEFGFSLAQEFEAVIHLVHAIEPFVYRDTMLPKSLKTEALTEATTDCRKRLNDLVPADAHNWCDIEVACKAGKPFEVLKNYAEAKQVDLIVLGVRGHSLVETMLIGATTDRVIRNVACPVLSVCPP